jgi:SAUR family protein
MDTVKGKCKKNLIFKAWERCRSLGARRNTTSPEDDNKSQKKSQVAPEGCFPVYVGPQRQRFVVKAKFANHPLFVTLLEDAESEYGYNSEGPILLPCDVDLFHNVLAEMDGSQDMIGTPGCGFAKGYGSLIFPRSPARSPNFSISKGGHGAYI